MPFLIHNFLTNSTTKVILKGVSTNITRGEIMAYHVIRGFDVNLVKRFGPKAKSILIVLVVFKRNTSSTKVYNITSIF